MSASVTDITTGAKPGPEGSYVWMQIQRPVEFQGLQLSLMFLGWGRAQARSEYPIGSVWEVVLPLSERATLQKAKRDEEHVQRQIDAGVPKEMISQLVFGPQLKISDLPVSPVRKEIK